ncbi:MAG TPA: ATP-binding protein [Actinophytocola sp.]|uniref:sensor histidine kinase n=1 Tax=Actinophytocola sp. TaxID=1872138 RepID=UPI002F945DA9
MIHQEPEGAVVDICASIALRDLNLVDSLLSLLETMEESEADPDRLTELYRLDHLAARLRRNAENLRVLAGRDASDAVSDSASLVDVIRAAMSSIDAYSRVSIGRVLQLGVVGIAADDLSRLLAELLDNGAKQSPPDTSVRVSAHLTDSGSVLMRIEDDGIGMPAERVSELNSRLSDEPKLNDDSVRHMGLAVVRRLASRHDMRVRLDRRSPHGTTAMVLLPPSLLCELPDAAWSGSQTVVRSAAMAHRAPLPAQPEPASVPAARRPSPRPRHSAEPAEMTASGLPKRTRAGGRPASRPPQPEELVDPGRTVNGLPRRVSRSIKNPDHGAEGDPLPQRTPEEEHAGHEQLLADLDAFAAGEQAARGGGWPEGTDPDSPPGPVAVSAPEAPEAPEAPPVPEATDLPAAPEASPAPEVEQQTEQPVEQLAEPVEQLAEPVREFAPAPEPQAAPQPEARPAWQEQSAYAPDSIFDAATDSTPTPPRGFPMPPDPEADPERGRDGGAQ